MKHTPYTFSVVRYSHDPSVGELVNVGVLLYAKTGPFVGAQFDHHTEHLGRLFSEFHSGDYLTTIRALKQGADRLMQQWQKRPLTRMGEGLASAREVGRLLVPDRYLGFVVGDPLSGTTDNLPREVGRLFDRFVRSQRPAPDAHQRRSDVDVWRTVYERALPAGLSRLFSPHQVETPTVAVSFDYAVKNGRWHVLQPLSFDYVTSDAIQRKATGWLGTTMALAGSSDISSVAFLLGRPMHPGVEGAYDRAKSVLQLAPRSLKTTLVEEAEADVFSRQFLADLTRQGVTIPEA